MKISSNAPWMREHRKAKTTTLIRKLLRGTRLMAVPNGNKVLDRNIVPNRQSAGKALNALCQAQGTGSTTL